MGDERIRSISRDTEREESFASLADDAEIANGFFKAGKCAGLTFLRPLLCGSDFNEILPSDDQKSPRGVFAFISGETRPETQHGFPLSLLRSRLYRSEKVLSASVQLRDI